MAATVYVIGDGGAVRSIPIPHAAKFGIGNNEVVSLTAPNGAVIAYFSMSNVLGVVVEQG